MIMKAFIITTVKKGATYKYIYEFKSKANKLRRAIMDARSKETNQLVQVLILK